MQITQMATGDCCWLEQFEQLTFDLDCLDICNPKLDKYDVTKKTLLYCDCEEPETIKNNAGGKPFYYCKKCKKEWVKPTPPELPW